jgi:regulatory protein
VEIEGAGSFCLDAETIRALGLTEGAPVAPDLVVRVAEFAGRRQATAVALGLLRRRLRSRAELEAGLLRRGVHREVVLAVTAELRRQGWIDDARFAKAWVRDRLALRPRGMRRLRAELLAKGVSASVADEAIAALVPAGSEDGLALEQARSWLRRMRGLEPEVARRRLVGRLARRGYAPETIVRTLRTLLPSRQGRSDADPAA